MRRLLIAAAFVIFAGSLQAQRTQVIDFEHVPSRQLDPQYSVGSTKVLLAGVPGYAGMTWSGADLDDLLWFLASPEFMESHGYLSDGSTVAYGSENTFYWFSRPGQPFTLNSIFLGMLSVGGPPAPLSIAASGRGGVQYSTFITPSTTSIDRYDFGWADVETVSIFTSSPGIALIDNISITTATPEPSTLILVATGLIGIAGVARRRRVAAA